LIGMHALVDCGASTALESRRRLVVACMAWGKSTSAYERLKDLVIEGKLRPGQHIDPGVIARQFGVSKTPVLEALSRLADEGFFIHRASGGYFTKFFTVQEQRNLHQLLLVTFIPCLDWSAATRRQPLFATLTGLADALAPGAILAPEACVRHIETVYAAIAGATDNALIQANMGNAIERTHLLRVLDLGRPERRAMVTGSVRGIVAAIMALDRNGALDLADAHMREKIARLEALVGEANAVATRAELP
jgi:DNA-binding GntR family transcriptional regulator